ncbi:DUF6678 family protein [Shinella sp.]|uniref:DUF6678 family protein n=1 Tax=Shinella sp. TaxID=1870904 RepID=UPI00403602F8
MSVHTREELERISRLARREFSCALMSDTKWRKLFLGLSKAREPESQMLVQFLEVVDVHVMHIPVENALWCPLPYIDTHEFGPVELRAIEWLEIPKIASWPRSNNLPPRQIVQDLDKFRVALRGFGHFPLIEMQQGMRFEGYKR